MDDTYIKKRLKKLTALLYNGKPFAKKTKSGKFVFGVTDKKGIVTNKNIVEKGIAIYLIIEKFKK